MSFSSQKIKMQETGEADQFVHSQNEGENKDVDSSRSNPLGTSNFGGASGSRAVENGHKKNINQEFRQNDEPQLATASNEVSISGGAKRKLCPPLPEENEGDLKVDQEVSNDSNPLGVKRRERPSLEYMVMDVTDVVKSMKTSKPDNPLVTKDFQEIGVIFSSDAYDFSLVEYTRTNKIRGLIKVKSGKVIGGQFLMTGKDETHTIERHICPEANGIPNTNTELQGIFHVQTLKELKDLINPVHDLIKMHWDKLLWLPREDPDEPLKHTTIVDAFYNETVGVVYGEGEERPVKVIRIVIYKSSSTEPSKYVMTAYPFKEQKRFRAGRKPGDIDMRRRRGGTQQRIAEADSKPAPDLLRNIRLKPLQGKSEQKRPKAGRQYQGGDGYGGRFGAGGGRWGRGGGRGGGGGRYNDDGEVDPNSEQYRTLFVGGLSHKTNEDGLRSHFEKWGEIVDCVVIHDPKTKRSRGFAFITYEEAGMIDDAQRNRPHKIDNTVVETKRAMPSDWAGTSNNQFVKKMFIGGMKDDTTKKHIRDVFSPFGAIKSVKIVRDKTGKPRGFAFVTFEDYDAVDKAVLKRRHNLNGRKVEAKKALPKDQMDGISGGKGDGMSVGRGRGRGGYSQRGPGPYRGGYGRGDGR